MWISPIYPSPFADQGYDISDYYNIDPSFGTLEDMDELIREAKKRDMYILMDLVVNHCSDEHEWFEKACADPDGEYGNFFYIEDRKEGQELPCNWRSYFGGSVWEPLPGHPEKQYMHVFHKKQPDLNWENPVVREEVYKNVNWWLDKGLAGFRIDAIINIKKKLPYKNYPTDREDGLCDIALMLKMQKVLENFLENCKDVLSPSMMLFLLEKYLMKSQKSFLILLEMGDTSLLSSTFLPMSGEAATKDGMTARESHRMLTKNAILMLREKLETMVSIPTLLKTMTSPAV